MGAKVSLDLKVAVSMITRGIEDGWNLVDDIDNDINARWMIIVIIHDKFVKVKLYNESFTITQPSLKSRIPTVNKNAV